MTSVSGAVVELRKHRKETQQQFAWVMNLSISALQNYEKARTPETSQLLKFQRLAETSGREDLAKMFQDALTKKLALDIDHGIFITADRFESLAVGILLGWIRSKNPAAQTVIKQIAKELSESEMQKFLHEAVRRGFIKTSPKGEKSERHDQEKDHSGGAR